MKGALIRRFNEIIRRRNGLAMIQIRYISAEVGGLQQLSLSDLEPASPYYVL